MEGRRPVVVTCLNMSCVLVGQRNVTYSAIFKIFRKCIVKSERMERDLSSLFPSIIVILSGFNQVDCNESMNNAWMDM